MVVRGEQISVSNSKVKIIDGVYFEVGSGEHYTILGKAGSGKSTLVHALLNLTQFDGELIWSKSLQKPNKIRAVLQNQILEKRLSVLELCHLHKSLLKSNVDIENLLSVFELQSYADDFTESLTPEHTKMLQVVLALLSAPQVLIVDAIEENLNEISAQRIWRLLKKYQQMHGLTLICTSKEVNSFVKQSDRLLILDKGKVVHCGKSEDLVRFVYKNTKKASFVAPPNFLFTKFDFPFVRKKKSIEVGYESSVEVALFENIQACGGQDIHMGEFSIEDALGRLLCINESR